MMLGIVRRARLFPLIALFVIAASVASSMSAFLHDAGDDAFCQTLPASSDGSGQRMAAARAAAPPSHCAICHWLKSLQTALHSTSVASLNTAFQPIVVSPIAVVGLAAEDGLPARAPPRA